MSNQTPKPPAPPKPATEADHTAVVKAVEGDICRDPGFDSHWQGIDFATVVALKNKDSL